MAALVYRFYLSLALVRKSKQKCTIHNCLNMIRPKFLHKHCDLSGKKGCLQWDSNLQ